LRCRNLYAAFCPIDGNLEVESFEDLPLDLRRCRPEARAEVRNSRRPPFEFLILGLVLFGTQLGQSVFQLVLAYIDPLLVAVGLEGSRVPVESSACCVE